MIQNAQTKDFSQNSSSRGLVIRRHFTQQGISVLGSAIYEKRTSIIRNTDGSVVFEIKDIEVPKGWSQVATDILAQKYFRKAGVPLTDELGNPLLDENGKRIMGGETSVRQVIKRLTGCWRSWGEKNGYFASADDAQIYEQEMQYMLLYQMGAPNSPQWFNTGLHWAYGITGPAQGHYYYDPLQGKSVASQDAYSRPQPHACFIQSVNDSLVNEGGIFDLAIREARIFKYGSGTGSNFSQLRAEGESLSGGGKSSGLMSWLRIFNAAAGAIKSGGTTRRAAKMVCLDMDHPDIEKFIMWKMYEEQKVASLVAGSKACQSSLTAILQQARINPDMKTNKELVSAVIEANKNKVPHNYILRVIQLAQQGKDTLDFPVFDTHFESEAYNTVSGQNSNNSVRVPNTFMKALEQGESWNLTYRTSKEVAKQIPAVELWDKVCFAAWSCADPGIQYDTTINEWHTCPAAGRINASNPCSEYMFLDDTACNLASLNLVRFLSADNTFDVKGFMHAVRLWTITLEISVMMAQFPSPTIAKLSYQYRTLGLGYANLGSLLMRTGIPYDSDKGRSIAAAITAMMTGKSYATSAEMAANLGPFEQYDNNKESMLRVMRNHRRAAYNASSDKYEGLSVTPVGIDVDYCPSELLEAARKAWDEALDIGEKYGYRNAQTTVLAPTGTIGLLMDCDTTGIEPDFALVKFKKLAGGGYFKIVNQAVPSALKTLGYDDQQINAIVAYCVGHGTIKGCPHINPESLAAIGLPNHIIDMLDEQMKGAFDLGFVFNTHNIGMQYLRKTGLSEQQLNDPSLNVLHALGFTQQQISEANTYVCGTMTVEGAPGLRENHLSVFDCANKCGNTGTRMIAYMAHIQIMAATQPFISGAISKTINMSNEATVQDISDAYTESWRLMLKAVALYRDGSKLSQPLNTVSGDNDILAALLTQQEEVSISQMHNVATQSHKGPLPSTRTGMTIQVKVGGHDLILRTGEYSDGTVGEVVVDMYKQGSSYGELMHSFSQAISIGLEHGVPLEEYVDAFTFTKFEPNGIVTGHDLIKNATSPVDFVARSLAARYLGREDLVHVNKNTVQDQNTNKDVSVAEQAELDKSARAKAKGYTGESCPSCGSMELRRNGTCAVCENCGSTTGCS